MEFYLHIRSDEKHLVCLKTQTNNDDYDDDNEDDDDYDDDDDNDGDDFNDHIDVMSPNYGP